MLLSKEEEIDSFLETLREQGYYTVRGWVQTGITWLGGALINTAIKVCCVLIIISNLNKLTNTLLGRRGPHVSTKKKLQYDRFS